MRRGTAGERGVEALLELFTSPGFHSEVFAFMERHAPAFAVRDAREQKLAAAQIEHRLEWSRVHAAFCHALGSRLERHVEAQGVSVAEVGRWLEQRGLDEAKAGGANALVHALLTVFEYETFVEVMRDKERRDYLRRITEGWARQFHGS
jgi:hypothetical protein